MQMKNAFMFGSERGEEAGSRVPSPYKKTSYLVDKTGVPIKKDREKKECLVFLLVLCYHVLPCYICMYNGWGRSQFGFSVAWRW